MPTGVDLATAIDMYAHLLVRQHVPKKEQNNQLAFLREFSRSLGPRVAVSSIGMREVIEYFADHANDYVDPNGWLERYKILDTFFDALVDMGVLPANRIKGIYDDTDPEPELIEHGLPDEPPAPVDWSQRELPLGFRRV
jgi:hypothetical protein